MIIGCVFLLPYIRQFKKKNTKKYNFFFFFFFNNCIMPGKRLKPHNNKKRNRVYNILNLLGNIFLKEKVKSTKKLKVEIYCYQNIHGIIIPRHKVTRDEK